MGRGFSGRLKKGHILLDTSIWVPSAQRYVRLRTVEGPVEIDEKGNLFMAVGLLIDPPDIFDDDDRGGGEPSSPPSPSGRRAGSPRLAYV